MPEVSATANHLLLTEQGERWLRNFEESDRGIARDLASALLLVSHNAFEREITALINQVAEGIDGPIALYAAREVESDCRILDESEIDATPRGSDIGSEGRVASIIRNLVRRSPARFLNHPSLDELRMRRADAIFVVDDFIGSGKRCSEYIGALWQSRSLRSWVSYHRLKLMAVAFSGTSEGIVRVEQHACHPLVHIARHCPTITNLHWKNARIEAAKDLCRKYGRRARLNWIYGFGGTVALLAFEHGCPNNVPAIFWGESTAGRDWIPLFKANRVDETQASTFPPELHNPSPVSMLIEAGQQRLASALAQNMRHPLTDKETLTLALFAKGKTRDETVANSLGLPPREATALVERCIEAGWITPRRRITEAGLAELRGITNISLRRPGGLPDIGEEAYYPTALRGRGNG